MEDPGSFISFYFLNINGLKTNFDEFVLNHQSIANSFDIICLAETNVDSCDINTNRYQLSSDYLCLDIPKLPDKQKGSGLALYYRKSLKLSLVEELCNYGTDSRFQILGGKLKTATGFLHFLVIYRFHACAVQDFCSELDALLETINGPCIILGDFNINCFSFDPSQAVTNVDTELYVNSLLGKGFSPLISKGTRFDNHINNTVTCIDQIWINMLSQNIRSGVISSSVSDHLPIFSFIPVTPSSILAQPNLVNTSNKKYAVTPVTLDTFSNRIPHLISSTSCYSHEGHSVAQTFSFFHHELATVHDECLIDKNPKSSSRSFTEHPWISVALARSSKVKNILYKRWIRSKGSLHEASTCNEYLEERERYNEYRNYRSKLRDLIKVSKTNYFKDLFEKNNGNARKTWGVINKIRCKMKGSSPPPYIEFNQQLITDRRTMSSLFNSYFTEVANKLNDDKYGNAVPPADDYRKFLGVRCCNSILLYDIEPDEIVKIISSFNNNKSSDLCVRAIKHVRHEIAPILSTLFNKCMAAGIFPAELKIAKVIPLFKSGKRHILSNYRPISILPLFSKIFEKLLHIRMTSFFDKENILSENQFGFRKKHSTVHALNTAVSSVTQSMNDRCCSIGLFIDFSKAFDTIKHDILLRKLEHYGIRGLALDLLTDYLSSRFQYVTLDGVCSDLLPISIGVPQGSVLGPLLFIVYINDIANCVSDSNKSLFILFADDTNIFIQAKTIIEAQSIAESTLQSVSYYLFANYLHINIKKTKYVVFNSSRRNPPPCKITLDSLTLTRVRAIKFLGVILDEKLDWSNQTSSIVCKLSKTCGVLYDLGKSLPASLRAPVVNALVNSHISYGITVWGGNPSNLVKVFTSQKKCIRSLFKLGHRKKVKGVYIYGHTKSIFTKNMLLSAHNLYNYSMILDAFKMLSSNTPSSYFKRCYSVSPRNHHRLLSAKCDLSSLSTNFSYRIPTLWNSFLNVSTIRSLSLCGLKTFKRSLKAFFLQMQNSVNADSWHSNDNDLVSYCSFLHSQCQELISNQPRLTH